MSVFQDSKPPKCHFNIHEILQAMWTWTEINFPQERVIESPA